MKKILVLGLSCLVLACQSPRYPRYHRVQATDTFASIVSKYGLDPLDLLVANKLSDPEHLRVGQTLFLPHDIEQLRSRRRGVGESVVNKTKDSKVSVALPPPSRGKRFAWPTRNPVVTSKFGWRGSHMHEGIDLRAKVGTAIYASDRAVVVYAGNKLSGYGNIVVLDHGDDWVTVYGHLSRMYVRAGQWVHRRQKIALSGNTGRSTAPHLHFEIRKGATPVDPLRYLPR